MKIYTVKIHTWVTEEQAAKLRNKTTALGKSQAQVMRDQIEENHPYANILAKKTRIDGKCGGLLNQVARVLNTTARLGDKEQAQLDRIERHLARSNKIMERIARK